MDHVTSDITDITKAHAITTLSAATTYWSQFHLFIFFIYLFFLFFYLSIYSFIYFLHIYVNFYGERDFYKVVWQFNHFLQDYEAMFFLHSPHQSNLLYRPPTLILQRSIKIYWTVHCTDIFSKNFFQKKICIYLYYNFWCINIILGTCNQPIN